MSALSTVDFLVPFDPTSFATISGAMLEQLVGGLAPNLSVGLFIVTTDVAGVPQVPAANTTVKWQNYGWLRLSPTLGATIYIWNPFGANSPTLLQWQIANINSITAGSITGAQIAANTITYQNIASVLWSQLPSGGSVGGCLTGSMPNPALANNVVGTNNISPLAVTGGGLNGNITANTITNYNLTDIDANGILDENVSSIASGNGLNPVGATGKLLVPAGSTGKTLKVNAAGNQFELFADLFSNLLETGIGTAFQTPQVNSGATGLQWTPHQTLQKYTEQNATGVSTTTVLSAGTQPTTLNTTLATNFGAAGTITFTPLSASSLILIEININAGILGASSNASATFSLFKGITLLNTFEFAAIGSTTGAYGSVLLSYWLASTSTSALSLSVYYAGSVASTTTYINKNAWNYSTVKITEYL